VILVVEAQADVVALVIVSSYHPEDTAKDSSKAKTKRKKDHLDFLVQLTIETRPKQIRWQRLELSVLGGEFEKNSP
jgi:hypothetical protein